MSNAKYYLSLEEAFQTYQHSQAWYPKISHEYQQPEYVNGLRDILDKFDLVLLDSYGVLSRGSEVIPQAQTCFQYLRKNQVLFHILSNDTSASGKNILHKYTKRGYQIQAEEITTSLEIVQDFLEEQTRSTLLNNWAIMTGLQKPLGDLTAQMQDLITQQGILSQEVSHLLFMIGADWGKELQKVLEQQSINPTCQFIIGNPDVAAPHQDKMIATPGYYAWRLGSKVQVESLPILLGKPGKRIFQKVLSKFPNISTDKILMVGDTIHTDIWGAKSVGIATMLVKSGIFQSAQVEKYLEEAQVWPDYIAPTI